MKRTLLLRFVLAGVIGCLSRPVPALTAADTEPAAEAAAGPAATDANGRTRWVFFSPPEIARVRRQVEEENQQREVYRRIHATEPIILLAPFIVEGDDSLLLASIRRQLALTPASLRERIAQLAPMLANRAAYSARVTDEFFNPGRPTPGSPRGRTGMFRLDFVELASNPPQSLAEVFRAP